MVTVRDDGRNFISQYGGCWNESSVTHAFSMCLFASRRKIAFSPNHFTTIPLFVRHLVDMCIVEPIYGPWKWELVLRNFMFISRGEMRLGSYE
jgi:hypothetical protein